MVQMQVRSQVAQVGVSTTTANAAPIQLSLTVMFQLFYNEIYFISICSMFFTTEKSNGRSTRYV